MIFGDFLQTLLQTIFLYIFFVYFPCPIRLCVQGLKIQNAYKLIMDIKELIGMSMMGMIKEPIISKMVGAELLTDKDKNNDLIGLGLMMNNQPMKKFSVYNGSVIR